MIGDKIDFHRFGIDSVQRIDIFLHCRGQPVDIAGFRRLGNQAFRLAGGKMEAVDRRRVPVRDAFPVPYFRHGIYVRVDGFQFPDIPGPELQVFVVLVQVQVFGRVKAEPVHAQFQVELRDFQDFLPHCLGIEVQFRHRAGEIALHLDAGGVFLHKSPARGRFVIRSDIGIVIVAWPGRIVHGMGVQEPPVPDMLAAGMVQRQVQDHLYIPFMADRNQFPQVVHRPEGGIDRIVIHHIIFMVGRGFEDRRQPDSLHPQAFSGCRISVIEVIHPVDDSPQVARSVSVGVGEGAHKNLIEHPVVVHNIPSVIKCQAFRHTGSRQRRQRQQNNRRHDCDPLLHNAPPLSEKAGCAGSPPFGLLDYPSIRLRSVSGSNRCMTFAGKVMNILLP